MKNRKPSPENLWRLATNLKLLREARGYTQIELGHRCGLGPGYIGIVEREAVNITLANLQAPAHGLDCFEEDLLCVRDQCRVAGPTRRSPLSQLSFSIMGGGIELRKL